MSDEQFLTSPFLPRFHLFSHKLNFFEVALRAPLGPPGPGALAPATPLSRWACYISQLETCRHDRMITERSMSLSIEEETDDSKLASRCVQNSVYRLCVILLCPRP